MSGITQIRLGGFGGQGIVLAGVLLGHAGVIEGKQVSVSNSYGVAARGSDCKAEIIFAQCPIDYPHLLAADFFVAMSQGAYNAYLKDVRPGSGLVLFDEGFVRPRELPQVDQKAVPATNSAIAKLQERQAANIVLLGALVEASGIVSAEAVRKAIRTQIDERFRALNLKALSLGVELGRQLHG
jgi:2-oxoglutarate ferredoxin oxidoreductase subunit gamma